MAQPDDQVADHQVAEDQVADDRFAGDDVPDEHVALVLGGGGARGAYEAGALAVLLPELERRGQRPRIIIGNSVGALNAAYVAAHSHLAAADFMPEGKALWEGLRWSDVLEPLVSMSSLRRILGYAGQVLGVPGARLWSVLDSAPLTEGLLDRVVDFERLDRNVEEKTLYAVGIVATSALTRRTVVFHKGGEPRPDFDERRLIDYVEAQLAREHLAASLAIPAAFPAAMVRTPPVAKGWYFDGAPRMNAPLKPALALEATRIVVIGLGSLAPGPKELADDETPDAFAGLGQDLHGLLWDQFANDARTLADINRFAPEAGKPKRVPYILIAPERPGTIERMALRFFEQRYCGVRGITRCPDVFLLGRLTGALSDVRNATAVSTLMFDPDYLVQLVELGEADARKWVDTRRAKGEPLWQLLPLDLKKEKPLPPGPSVRTLAREGRVKS